MTKLTCAAALVFGLLIISAPVRAEDMPTKGAPLAGIAVSSAPTIEEYTSRVLALNQISPKQNPQYQLGTKVLSRRLIDQNRRGLGDVTDIALGAGGALKSVEANVVATGFDQDLSFDVTAYNVNPESDAYSVTLTRDQIENNIPEFMANIATAAGDTVNQPITVKSLIGGRVQTNKGNQVAVVNDVLIDEKRKAAVALLLTLMGGSGRTTIAVPYADAKIERLGSKSTIELSEEQARVVNNFAHKKN